MLTGNRGTETLWDRVFVVCGSWVAGLVGEFEPAIFGSGCFSLGFQVRVHFCGYVFSFASAFECV